MANDVQTGAEQPSLTSLVSGIVQDVQDLIKQQMAYTQREIQEDLRRTKEAVTPMAIGLGVSLLALGLLCVMLVHLLHWLTDGRLPLWGCYAIVGVLLAVAGGVLFYAGKKQLDSFNPLPDKSVEALKENVQWLTNQKK